MDVWHLLLYSAASFLALKSLVSLMTHQRQVAFRQLMLEDHLHNQQLKAEQKRTARMTAPVKKPGVAA
ncbi:MAG: hypothetical protein KDA79_20855 [Planctomycetaceae bacterium]|nr:hypothetical protein [Planctomycetaceae bacterium]